MSFTSEYQLERPLAFQLSDKTRLETTLVAATLVLDDDGEDDCQIVIHVPFAAYQTQVQPNTCFHLTPLLHVTGDDAGFVDGTPVEITLRLARPLRIQLIDTLSNGEELAKKVLSGSPSTLLETDLWYALKVMQEMRVPSGIAEGTVKSGYKTIWAGEPTGDIFAAAIEFLLSESWPIHRPDDSTRLSFTYEGDNGDFECKIEAREPLRIGLVYSQLPLTVPQNRLQAVNELIARINFDVPFGNFELNWDKGIVRYKTSLDVEGDRMSAALMRNLVVPNVLAMEFYMPAFIACINGTAPQTALEKIEDD